MEFKMDDNDTDIDENIFVNETYYDLIRTREVQTFFCVVYTTIFVLGIFGNILTCYVVFQNRAMQTVTNYFITNLALSDILQCALCVPFTPSYTFFQQWIFGAVLCHLVSFAQGTFVYISTLTLTSIAVDRFFVIIYPFHPRMKPKTCFCIIFSIWFISVLATLPYGIYMKYTPDEPLAINSTDTFDLCEEKWPSEGFRKIFGGITFTMQFVVPFFIITFCYIKVSLRLNDRARCKPGSKNSRKEEADRERKRRTNRMLIGMVLIFGLSWLPLSFVNVVNDFHTETSTWRYYNVCFFLVHALAMSSTCYNPFLYAWLNENFRKEFKQVLPGFDSSNRRSSNERMGNWKSERTCNGNETVQETLLQSSMMRRCSSIRMQLTEVANKGTEEMKDSVEIENVLVPKVVYKREAEQHIELHMTTDDNVLLKSAAEHNRSSPPSEPRTKEEFELLIGSSQGEAV